MIAPAGSQRRAGSGERELSLVSPALKRKDQGLLETRMAESGTPTCFATASAGALNGRTAPLPEGLPGTLVASSASSGVGGVFTPAVVTGVYAIADAAAGRIDGMLKDVRAGFAELELSDPGRQLPLQAVGDRLRQAVPSLAIARSAYPGLREFLQWATVDTPYCLFRRVDSQERVNFHLGMRSCVPDDAAVLPGLDRRPPQIRDPVRLYRLLASQGKPLIRLPEPDVAAQVLRAIAARGVSSEDLTSVINDVADALGGGVSTADVKNVVVILARSAILRGEPADASLQDRTYSLAGSSTNVEELRHALLSAVRDKLESRLGSVDQEVLEQLVQR